MVTTFTKRSPFHPRSYPAEAAGLRWLAAAGSDAARMVEVLEVSAQQLTLRRLVSVRPTARAAVAFGSALARTHGAGAAAFGQPPDGWSGDGFIGRQHLSLRPEERWGVFYADQRLVPYAEEAHRRGTLSTAGRAAVDRVAERLHAGDFDDGAAPARIHGDLWSGNLVFTAEGVVLIDPAAHGGHRLTDLAMLALFGAPQLSQILDGYRSTGQLLDGWPELIGLHQLHPLLVHAVTHGSSYGAEAASTATRYG